MPKCGVLSGAVGDWVALYGAVGSWVALYVAVGC